MEKEESMQKHALLIAYYWPPAGGAGVHRWLRMSKYFSESNVKLTVYCPSNPSYPIVDEDLLKEVKSDVTVIKRKIIEPNQFLNSDSGAGFASEKKPSPIKKLLVWIRGNLFIPDARMLWIRPSVRYLNTYLKNHPEITTIISSGPPHSMHLIARKLKAKRNLHWIADFRDPWSGIDYADDLNMSDRAKKRNLELEANVLKECDECVTVSKSIAEELGTIGQKEVHVITNGFEFDLNFEAPLTQQFTIGHFGSMPKSRNPIQLWKVLSELIQENEELKKALQIELYGNVDRSILESLKEFKLSDNFIHGGNKSHAESIQLQRSMQMLLLIINNTGNTSGTLTGKFFEYLNSKRPILTISPEKGDMNKVLMETNSGQLFTPKEEGELKTYILDSFEQYKLGALQSTRVNLEKYDSSFHAKKFTELVK